MHVPEETYQEVLGSLYTAAQMAKALGISQRRVTALAESRSVGTRVGGTRLFTPYDLERLRERRPGHQSANHPAHPPRSRGAVAES